MSTSVERLYEAIMRWSTEQHGDEVRGSLSLLVKLVASAARRVAEAASAAAELERDAERRRVYELQAALQELLDSTAALDGRVAVVWARADKVLRGGK